MVVGELWIDAVDPVDDEVVDVDDVEFVGELVGLELEIEEVDLVLYNELSSIGVGLEVEDAGGRTVPIVATVVAALVVLCCQK